MNKTRRVSLAIGAVAIVGVAALALGNYLLPGGLFQSALFKPVDTEVPIGTGFTSPIGYNFTFNPDLKVDDGSITSNTSLQQYLGGASNVSNKNGSDNFPDAWTDNPDAYYAYGIQPGTADWPVNKLQTNPATGLKRLLMDARDKAVGASIRQISYLPADKLKKGDKFVLRAWVSSANNADQDTQVQLTLGHNNCLACWPKGYVKLVNSSTDWVSVPSGSARMITTPILTITGDEVMNWDAAQGRLMLIASKFPAGTTSFGGVEGNLFSQLNVKPGHAAYVERVEVVKVSGEDGSILANGNLPADNSGYVRTIQPDLPTGTAPYLPAGWASGLSHPLLGCGLSATAITNTGAGIRIDSGTTDGCIYQYKVQGDWNPALKKYASNVKVGDEYVTKTTVQGINADAYIGVTATHLTEPDLTTLSNYDFDHVKVWGTAKKDTPTVLITTPLKVTSEDATGLHVLGASVIVYGPNASALVTKVEMIKCTKDANGDYQQTDCKSNNSSTVVNADMNIDQGIPYTNVTSPNTVANDTIPDQWGIQCYQNGGATLSNAANALKIDALGVKVQMPNDAADCYIMQMQDVPMVKGDTYVAAATFKSDAAVANNNNTYLLLSHDPKWNVGTSTLTPTSVRSSIPRDLGNGMWETVTGRLQVVNPNLIPGQATYWNFRREILFHIGRTTALNSVEPAMTIMHSEIIPCSSIDKTSDKFKNYCVQDILPSGNRVSSNPGLGDTLGLLAGSIANDIVPDGWSIWNLTDATKDHASRITASNALKNILKIDNQDVNASALLALAQDIKVPDVVGKKFMGVAKLRGGGDSDLGILMRLSHNGDTEFADGVGKIAGRAFSSFYADLSQFRTYTTAIFSPTAATTAGKADLTFRIHPGHNYPEGIEIQSAKVLQIDDGDLETIHGKLQLKPTLNGSFEKDNGTEYGMWAQDTTANNGLPDGWAKTGCTADSQIVTTDKTDGNNSLKLTQNGTSICMMQQASRAPITPGDLYMLSAKVKNIGSDDGVFQMRWVHNFGNTDLTEVNPDEAYSGQLIPKNSDWITVRYPAKIKLSKEDAPYDITSMTEIFNVTNTSGLTNTTNAVAPLLVDDVKFTNCTENPTAVECIETPDASIAPTDQQLLYNSRLLADNGKLPLTAEDKAMIDGLGNVPKITNTAKDGMPDGWYIDGWGGGVPSQTALLSYNTIGIANNSGILKEKYIRFDTSSIPTDKAPLAILVQARNIPTNIGDKYRAVAYVRSADDQPQNVALNLVHNMYSSDEQVSGKATTGATPLGVASGVIRIETPIMTIKKPDNGSRGTLGAMIYLPRGGKIDIRSIELYRVPDDFSDLVANKNLIGDNGTMYTFGEYSANNVAADKQPDGWRSVCTNSSDGKDYTNSTQFLASGQVYPFKEEVYLQAFPDIAQDVGPGKRWATGAAHYAAFGKKEGRLDRPEYAAALQQLAPGYNENAYLLAYPDVARNVGPGRGLPSGLDHYLNQGKSENRLASATYTAAVTALGNFDKTLFKHNDGYTNCQIEQVQNTSTTIGDEYVAYAKVKNVSLKAGTLQLLIGHNWWTNLIGDTNSKWREPDVYSSDQTIQPGSEAVIKTGKLKITLPDGEGHYGLVNGTGYYSYVDLYKLGTALKSKVPSTAFKVSEINIVNCTKDPTNEMCLATADMNLLGVGNQLLVNNMFTADDGSVPQNKIALKMDKVPGNGVADGWEYDASKVTRTTFEEQPVLKVDAAQKTLQVKQTLKRDAKNKKYQAVVTVRTANPGNVPAAFVTQIYNNPYAPAPYIENLAGGGQSFTADGEFKKFTTPVLTVTQDDKSPALTAGYDNLFFNIIVPAGNMIYVQKAELFELADDTNVIVQNGSFEKDEGVNYMSLPNSNMVAGDKIPDGWTASNPTGITMVTTPVKSGTSALSITSDIQQGGKDISMSLDTATTLGDKYVAVANVYAANPASVGIKLMHNPNAPQAQQSAHATNTLTASGSVWTKLISQPLVISKPDSTVGENLKLSIAVLSPNATVIVDDVSLINCTKNPTTAECSANVVQNPILTNGNFELDNGTATIEGLGDSAANGIPDTWRRDCTGNGSMESTAGKTGTGILLTNSEAGGNCIYQYTNVQPQKNHIYVATADVKAAMNNIYTVTFDLLHNPNVTGLVELARTSNSVSQSWKTITSGPLMISKDEALPEVMPYSIMERFGVILKVSEGNSKVIFDNVKITDCTLSPTDSACTGALATVTAEKSATMGDGILVQGQTQQKVGSVKLTANTGTVDLQSLKVTAPASLSNFKLSSTGTTMLSGQSASGAILFTFGSGTNAVKLAKDADKTFDIYADVAAGTASGTTLQLSVAQNGISYFDSLFNKTSTTTVSALPLQQMTVKTTAPAGLGTLNVTKNAQLADQTLNKDGSNQKIGSFSIAATGDTYKVEVINLNLSVVNGISRLYLTSSGQLLGTTMLTPAMINTFGFASTPLYITAGTTATVDVYATLASASPATTLQTSLSVNAISAKTSTNVSVLAPATTSSFQIMTLKSLLPSAPTNTTTNTQGNYAGGGGTGSTGGTGLGQLPSTATTSTIVCPPSCETVATPKDVASTHFAYNAVKYLSARGILKGYADNTFRVNNAINRAEFVKVVSNGFQLTTTEKSAALPFKDIKVSDWFYNVLRTTYQAGLVKGYASGDFLPAKNIQRDEAVKIMALADAAATLKAKNKSLSDTDAILQAEALITAEWNTWKSGHAKYTYVQFTDASVNAWYAKYLLYAVEKEYISGRTINGVKVFAPADNITRGEAAVLVARIIDANKITYPAVKNADSTYTVKFPE